jgi:hypothetical protein
MNWNRILSSLLALLYICIAHADGGMVSVWKAGLFLILPLACIWFADTMGGYVGPIWRGSITGPTPRAVVCILGWVLILLPILIWLVEEIAGSKS